MHFKCSLAFMLSTTLFSCGETDGDRARNSDTTVIAPSTYNGATEDIGNSNKKATSIIDTPVKVKLEEVSQDLARYHKEAVLFGWIEQVTILKEDFTKLIGHHSARVYCAFDGTSVKAALWPVDNGYYDLRAKKHANAQKLITVVGASNICPTYCDFTPFDNTAKAPAAPGAVVNPTEDTLKVKPWMEAYKNKYSTAPLGLALDSARLDTLLNKVSSSVGIRIYFGKDQYGNMVAATMPIDKTGAIIPGYVYKQKRKSVCPMNCEVMNEFEIKE